MKDLEKVLLSFADKKYASFQAKLTPNISPDIIIGVRVPVIRKIAKQTVKDGSFLNFLNSLPHKYYDENMLHSAILSELKDYNTCISEIDKFLPFIDNWAVCDIIRPKVLLKNKKELLSKIKTWIYSDKPFICRFGIEMLMTYFLDADFNKEYLKLPLKIQTDDYYVNMMIAWFYATALAKQWESTVCIIENKQLNKWTHNKTIQKAVDSYRITSDQKSYLKQLKIT